VTISHNVSELKEVFFKTGNDVMLIYTPWGAVCSSYSRILMGDLDVLFMLHWYFVSISNRFQVIRVFHFGCDFSTGGEIWRFWLEMTHNSWEFWKNLLRGHFLASNRIFRANVRENWFMSLGCTRRQETKNKNTNLNLKSQDRSCDQHLKSLPLIWSEPYFTKLMNLGR